MIHPASTAASLADRIPPHAAIAREGWPFVGGALLVAFIGALLHWLALVVIGVLAAIACALFFRNPRRTPPADPNAVIAPADGRILTVETHDEPFFHCGPMQRISIFLSVADVHINRVPFDGRVLATQYKPGQFLMAYAPEASTRNECHAMHLRSDAGARDAVVVQIAGKIARRIVTYLQPGDFVEAGMRYGLIRFGSRVDVYLPAAAQIAVSPGMRVVGGESILARFPDPAHGGTDVAAR